MRLKRMLALLIALLVVLPIFAGCELEEEPSDKQKEKDEEYSFTATVLEINRNSVVVEPVPGSDVRNSSDQISFSTEDLEDIKVKVGSIVIVHYTGEIAESYPAQIQATSWELSDALENTDCSGDWIDKNNYGDELAEPEKPVIYLYPEVQ